MHLLSEQEVAALPGLGELLEKMPPVPPICPQVMGEDRKIYFPMVIAWLPKCGGRWLFILLQLKLPTYRGKELLRNTKYFIQQRR